MITWRNFVAIVCTLCATSVHAQQSRVDWYVLSGGGIASGNSSSQLRSVVGQLVVGHSVRHPIRADHGFLTDFRMRGGVTSVDDVHGIPTVFSLQQNYPNPFNPTTTIRYDLPKASRVRLTLYNLIGQEVVLLLDQDQPLGQHELTFDAAHLPSGVYFYRIVAGEYVEVKKLVLAR